MKATLRLRELVAGLLLGLVFLACLFYSWIAEPYWLLLPFALIIPVFFLLDIRVAFLCLVASLSFSVNIGEYIHQGLDFPDEGLMLWLTACFPFFLLLNYKRIPWKRIFSHPMILPVWLMLCWTLVSVVFSENPLLSSKFLFKKGWYLLPFLIMPVVWFQNRALVRAAFRVLIWPLSLIVLLVLYRYSALGFRFEDVHDPIQPFFVNHVMYGSMISCVVPFIAAALFLSRRFTLQQICLLVLLLVFLIAVYFSYSRAAWAAVLFAATAWVLVRWRLMDKLILLLYALLLSGVLWMATQNHYLNYRPKFEKTIMHQSLADHILATLQGTDISSAERYYRWIAAVRMSTDRPWTGVGPNNFYEYYKGYTVAAYRTWVSRNLERSTTHNYFLYMLVEQGYPAMVLYAFLIWWVFWYGQQVLKRTTHRFDRISLLAALAGVAAVFINNFFSELLETDKVGSLFFLCIALIAAIDLKGRTPQLEENLLV